MNLCTVTSFHISSCDCFDYRSTDAREQVLGNLANFAYDPINYEYMRQLNVIDLFLGAY